MTTTGANRSALKRQNTATSDMFAEAAANAESIGAGGGSSDLSAAGASTLAPAGVYDMLVSGITDPGVPGKQNQDDYILWTSADGQTVIVGVLDGHGRELGQMAAKVAKQSLLHELTRPEILLQMATSPKATFETAFANAHHAIEAAFKKYYEDAGWKVQRTDGYLVRTRPNGGGAPLCVHGGTTATVAVILAGRRLIVSNVGDSTAIICGLGTEGHLHSVDDWVPLPGVGGGPSSSTETISSSSSSSCSSIVPAAYATSYMEVSADHSPESESEFIRMHRFRPHSTARFTPELLFVYDTLTASKLACPHIFEVHPHTGKPSKTDRGSYYKNVRCEWATLVATPPHAGFQDALAFTRSLGDLHLQSYGVSHVPETWWMDITIATPSDAAATSSSSNSNSSGGTATAAVGAATASSSAQGSSTASSGEGGAPILAHMSPLSPFMIGAGSSSSSSSSSLSSTSNSGNVDSCGGGARSIERPLVPHPIALSVCSDGIWDNWKFEEVAGYLLTPSRVSEVLTTHSSETACNELMAANLDRARANFGSSADNMTAITVYLLPRT